MMGDKIKSPYIHTFRGKKITSNDDSTTWKRRRVRFASGENLETIHFFEKSNIEVDDADGNPNVVNSSSFISTNLTEEITVLSSIHGRARRYLREINKIELKTAVKYGVKERGHRDPKTGLDRWKYTWGDVVYITDSTGTEEVTCYRQPVNVQKAPISPDMYQQHREIKQALKDEPQLCSSITIVIIDQSGSMRNSDVNGFLNRSQAAYGCLALQYVAEQLYQGASGMDALTLIEMNDSGTVILEREPLDWILFNKLLDRKKNASPRCNGNYSNSLRVARDQIHKELRLLAGKALINNEDLPNFALVILSDGKPSDKELCLQEDRVKTITELASLLKDKLSVFCMGLGATGSDFVEMERLVKAAQNAGSQGHFNHAGLSAVNLGDMFSAISSTMTSLRTDLVDKPEEEDDRNVVKLKNRESLANSLNECNNFTDSVIRYKFNETMWYDYKDPWEEIPMVSARDGASGFKIDKIPFGKGAERLAFRFQEVDELGNFLGKMMVAKEKKGTTSDEIKKIKFHENFCRIQVVAERLAEFFNKALLKTPSLRPIYDYQRIPNIEFLKCRVYGFNDTYGKESGFLVENYLKGRFTKYNGNNGFVNRNKSEKGPTIELSCGTVALTDFLHAFSHWSYIFTQNRILVCDLQGVLNEEGRYPRFQLTDPAICSRGLKGNFKYGKTDIGWRGIRGFLHSHKCNHVCRCLGLSTLTSARKAQ